MVATADIGLFARVIESGPAEMREDLARYILALDFPAEEQERYELLASRVQEGALSSAEREELERFVRVNDMLAILRVKAMRTLRQPVPGVR